VPIDYEGGLGPRAFLNGLEKSIFPLPVLEPWTSSQYPGSHTQIGILGERDCL